MASLEEDYEEFIHNGQVLEQAKSDVSPAIEFSGVTDRLEDIKNNIELAIGGDETRRKFFDEQFLPFELMENALQTDFQSI